MKPTKLLLLVCLLTYLANNANGHNEDIERETNIFEKKEKYLGFGILKIGKDYDPKEPQDGITEVDVMLSLKSILEINSEATTMGIVMYFGLIWSDSRIEINSSHQQGVKPVTFPVKDVR